MRGHKAHGRGHVVNLVRHLGCAVVMSAAMTVSALAADLPVERQLWVHILSPPNPIAQWMVEMAERYWFSSGRTQKDLFGFAQSDGLLSRLTYTV